jgi:hypothetical protein
MEPLVDQRGITNQAEGENFFGSDYDDFLDELVGRENLPASLNGTHTEFPLEAEKNGHARTRMTQSAQRSACCTRAQPLIAASTHGRQAAVEYGGQPRGYY